MAWLSRNDFTNSDKLYSSALNNLANDDRAWGGNVNGGGYYLSNVKLDALTVGGAGGSGAITTSLPILGASTGSTVRAVSLQGATSNFDELSTTIWRVNNLSNQWDSAVWRIQRTVDSTNICAIDFGYMALGFRVSGNLYATLTSSGCFGIGNPYPTCLLDLADTSASDTPGSAHKIRHTWSNVPIFGWRLASLNAALVLDYQGSAWTTGICINRNTNCIGFFTQGPGKINGASTPHMAAVQVSGMVVVGGTTQNGTDDGLIQLGGFGFVSSNNWSPCTVFGRNLAVKSVGSADTYYTPLTMGNGYAGYTINAAGDLVMVGSSTASSAGGTVTPPNLLTVMRTGRVGIGMVGEAKLTVYGLNQGTGSINTSGSLDAVVELTDLSGSAGAGGMILFSAASTAWKYACIRGFLSATAGFPQGHIQFCTRRAAGDATLTQTMILTDVGNLTVVGTINCTGYLLNGAPHLATLAAGRDDLPPASGLNFWLDEAAGRLAVRYRNSAGVLKTGYIALE